MKASHLAAILMQHPDADVRIHRDDDFMHDSWEHLEEDEVEFIEGQDILPTWHIG